MNTDLETKLRDRLEQATDGLELPPEFWDDVGSRAKRHRIRTFVLAAGAAAAVLVGLVAGAALLGDSKTPVQPVVVATDGASPTAPTQGGWQLITAGTVEDLDWELHGRDAGEEICLRWTVIDDLREAFNCVAADALGARHLVVDFPAEAPEPMIGRVSDEVDKVELIHEDDTRTSAKLIDVTTLDDLRVFVVEWDASQGPVRLVARDTDGGILAENDLARPVDLAVEDNRVAVPFIKFAAHPSAALAAQVPFSPEGIQVGLGDELLLELSPEELEDPAAWEIEHQLFRARTGPFSPLNPIAEHVANGGAQDSGQTSNELAIMFGDAFFCASDTPVPTPSAAQGLRRINIQPHPSSLASCLSWFNVDLFFNGDGEIEIVTLDLWEP